MQASEKNVKIMGKPWISGVPCHAAWWWASVFLYGFMVLSPFVPGLPLAVAGQGVCYMIPWPRVNHLVALLAFAIPGIALLTYWRGDGNTSSRSRIWLPLAALPLSFAGHWFPGLVPLFLATNLLFFLPLALLALVMHRGWPDFAAAVDAQSPRRLAVLLLGGFTLFYAVTGWYLSSRIGEHAVDEGHYLVQARSVYEDGDLDIRNNLRVDVDRELARAMRRHGTVEDPQMAADLRAHELGRIRAYLHVSPKSPEDRWYSWHPFGISLLLAPTMGVGLAARQSMLGLIAATGIMLAFLLCVETGRSKSFSLLVCLLFGVSTYWFVYAVRALPEVLGATLVAAAMYAAFLSRTRPLAALLLLVGSCVYLPLVHPRFLPAGMWAGLFFLLQVFRISPVSPRMQRLYLVLMVVGALGIAGCGLVYYQLLNSITAYPLAGVLGAYPAGAWLSLFSERGLFFSLPMAAILLAGAILAPIHNNAHRAYFVVSGAALLTMLATLGTTDSWDGGPTMGGRYLVGIAPLLLPGAAWLVERAATPGRIWMYFLGLYSGAATLIGLVHISTMGAAILRVPFQAMREWFPLFRDLFFPYRISRLKTGHPYHGWDVFTANPFPVLLLFSTWLLLWPARGRKAMVLRTTMALLLLLASGAWLHWQHGRAAPVLTPARLESSLSAVPFQRARLVSETCEASSIMDAANRFDAFKPKTLTTDESARSSVTVLIQSRLERNDWAGRDYQWFTLVDPFSPGWPGPRALRLEGAMEGNGTIQMVVRQGRHTLTEVDLPLIHGENFRHESVINTLSGRGTIYLLFRIKDGEGSIRFDRVKWTAMIEP